MAVQTEFSVPNSYNYDRRGPVRWLVSHVWRSRWVLVGAMIAYLVGYVAFSYPRVLIGEAANEIVDPTGGNRLLWLTFAITGLLILDGIATIVGGLLMEVLAQRMETGAREELYTSLLAKSQTFHDRQRVGDIMARASDDTRQLNTMISPGLMFFVVDMVMGFAIPMTFIAVVQWQMLLVPVLFLVVYGVLVGEYVGRLEPVVTEQRAQFGVMNAGLEESISGIEVVKASAREMFERVKFRRNARKFRDLFVQQGKIEAGYLPLLVFGAAYGLTFLHAVLLVNAGTMNIGDVIGVMGLMGIIRFPVFISLFTFSLLQLGVSSAARILQVINEETNLDENADGHTGTIQGAITFENVGFAYDEKGHVLEDISFRIQPGQTVAIVGQTGSGKSTLTQLVNRTYDATSGRVLIDGVDVRDWNLDALRGQISKIEQDVFLFSRTIAENIAFGAPNAAQDEIEHAAKEAQAHDFIASFNEGYETKTGERGVTLSGGQRQRIALARAFLSDPRILILDDSTSAIDSATEDEIQKALRRAQEGRTTLLITHRLSQIRWADHILVLEGGHIAAQGTHEDLLRTSPHYRRIFARYMTNLPPLVEADGAAD